MLFVVAAGIVIIYLTGDPGIDYWDLDGEKKLPVSRLDVVRSKLFFYSAQAVLTGIFIAYLLLRR